jgi:hypothetical protein
MQIKTIKDGTASLRKVTLGHAVRILVCEVLQAEGVLDSMRAGNGSCYESMFDCHVDGVKPDRFRFSVEDVMSLEFTGNAHEVERFLAIVDLALKAGPTKPEKFDPLSQRIWMGAVLHRYEADSFHLACDYLTRSLVELSDEIDRIINRHGVATLAA